MRYALPLILAMPVCGCKASGSNTARILADEALVTSEPRTDVSYRQLSVSPDCAESGMTYETFTSLAKATDVNTQQEFLDRLPKDSMQTFTVLFASESTQSPGISKEYPGIIRMTQNGKLIFRYTCDRSVPETYGKVEVLHYDDARERFAYTEIDFGKSGRARIHENPDECADCHDVSGTGDPRPNWAMYPDWPGIFGSHDDFFPTGTAADTELVSHAEGWIPPNKQAELGAYQDFLRAKVKPGGDEDPCYRALPWPKPFLTGETIPPLYVNYPYGTYNAHARGRTYALRPNLKITEILSKLLARRNTRKLREHPDYEKVDELLAFEAARCVGVEVAAGRRFSAAQFHRKLAETLPDYERPDESSAAAVPLRGRQYFQFDPRHSTSLAQGLYGVSVAFGMEDNDWTLVLAASEPAFETGAGPGANTDFSGDLPLTAYVQHEILADVAKRLDLDGRFWRGTGEADDFGAHFQCIDALAGPTVFRTSDDRRATCLALATAAGL